MTEFNKSEKGEIESLKFEIENHIHNLDGFFIGEDEYKLHVIRTRSDKTEYEVNGKFSEFIKDQILFEFIYGPRLNHNEPNTKYTLELTLKQRNPKKANSRNNQKGGALLPPSGPLPAGACRDPLDVRFLHDISGDGINPDNERLKDVIGFYSEPFIKQIENAEVELTRRSSPINFTNLMDYLNEPPRRYDPFFISIRNLFITLRPPPGAATEAEKTARDAEIIAGMGDCNPGPLVAQDKHNYYEYRSYGWKRIILVHHLCENKYAHNGIGQDEIDSVLLNALYSKSYRNIVRIHTLLHSYDMLFMNKFGTENFWLNYSFIYGSLNRIRANAAGLYDRNFIKCYEHLLTAHAGDFLRRNAAGIITTPYRIQTDDAAALQQKTRQYDYQPNYIEIKERYQRQIRPAVFGAAPVVQAGTTTLLPNVEPFANLEIQIAAKKLEKTIDAVLGIAPIVGINIISVGQAINLCINTSSETGLLEGPAVGIVNVDVFNALITPHITDEDRALAAADAAAINAIINPAAAAAVPAAAAAAVPAGGVAVPGHNPRRRKTRRSYNLRHTRRKARRF